VFLEEEKKAASFHISKVSNFSCGTSTGNINKHLFDKHEIVVGSSQAGIPLILNYITRHRKSDVGSSSMAITQHEFNRDILIWFVRDLLALENVAKPGFTDFMKKVLPTCQTPCPETLSGRTALNDVYLGVFTKVKEELSQVRAICVMSDGWTDRYHGRAYVGIRVSFVKNWECKLLTLSCHAMPGSHTGQALADHIKLPSVMMEQITL